MSETYQMATEELQKAIEAASIPESAESMNDYAKELENSLKKIYEGDILTGTVINVSESEITLDLKYYTEGIIRLEDYSSNPDINLKNEILIGTEMTAAVISTDDGEGHILLSSREANDALAWERMEKYLKDGTIIKIKVGGIVNSGVIANIYGIRGFIPASKLSLNYVENLEEWLGKELDVRVITADSKRNRLVLSAREVLKEQAEQDRKEKLSTIQVGLVTEGTVDSIQPYGAFIELENGMSGLLHISQICEKRIKTPEEVLKTGEKVTVKIIDIKDGKLSLSMKALNDSDAAADEFYELPQTESVTTNLGSLFANIKLD